MIKQIFLDYKLLKKFPGFCTRLEKLLFTGISIQNSLKIVLKDETAPFYKEKIKAIQTQLLQGQNIIQTLPILLPQHLNFRLSSAQHSPNLQLFLKELALYYQTKLKNIQLFLQQISYPLFLSALSFILINIFVFTLFPVYHEFYQEMGLTLPFTLQVIINFTSFIKKNFIILFFFTLLLTTIFASKIHLTIQNLLYSLFFSQNTSDLIWLLAISLQNGFSLKEALSIIEPSPSHPHYTQFQKFKTKFIQSGNFTSCFTTYFPISSYYQELLLNSEKSTIFPDTLLAVAQNLNVQEQQKSLQILKYIQPILLLVIGLLLFLFVYCSFLPLLNSIESLTM